MLTSVPNLFLIGVPKAGTSALADGLRKHPDIFMSSKKELRFFDARTFYDFPEDYPIKNIEEYLRYYETEEALSSKYRLDASVFNVYDETSVTEILSLSPDAKFIVVLRDPLTATKSMFSQRMKYVETHMREISDDFAACWRALPKRKTGKGFPRGCRNKMLFRYDLLYSYERFLPKILEIVPRENIFIGFYEDFKENSCDFYKKLFRFLGLGEDFFIDNKIVNPSLVINRGAMLRFFCVCSVLAKKTFAVRERIGFSGKGILEKMTKKYKKEPPRISKELDEEITCFFCDTYKYLENLKNKEVSRTSLTGLAKLTCKGEN